jgi:hypothetical protein
MTTEFDKAKADVFYRQIQKAIKEIAAQHGLKVQKSSGRFTKYDFKGSFEVVVPGEKPSSGLPKEEAEFKCNARFYGLNESILNQPFVFAGETIAVVGSRRQNRKFPIIVAVNGKRFKVTPQWVTARLPAHFS